MHDVESSANLLLLLRVELDQHGHLPKEECSTSRFDEHRRHPIPPPKEKMEIHQGSLTVAGGKCSSDQRDFGWSILFVVDTLCVKLRTSSPDSFDSALRSLFLAVFPYYLEPFAHQLIGKRSYLDHYQRLLEHLTLQKE